MCCQTNLHKHSHGTDERGRMTDCLLLSKCIVDAVKVTHKCDNFVVESATKDWLCHAPARCASEKVIRSILVSNFYRKLCYLFYQCEQYCRNLTSVVIDKIY